MCVCVCDACVCVCVCVVYAYAYVFVLCVFVCMHNFGCVNLDIDLYDLFMGAPPRGGAFL